MRGWWSRWGGTLLGVGQNVVLPIAAYLVLVAVGWAPVWALAGSAGVSVVVLTVELARTGRVNALGGLVLLRFALSLALAWLTGDARVVLVKDSAITLAIAAVALASLRWRRPLIERIRTDLAADSEALRQRLSHDTPLRATHRRVTLAWSVGLALEATTSIAIALTLPITAAVVITNLTGPLAIVCLVAYTEWRCRSVPVPGATMIEVPPPR